MKIEWSLLLSLLFIMCILIAGIVMTFRINMRLNGETSYLRAKNIKLQNQIGFLEVENFHLREALEKKQ